MANRVPLILPGSGSGVCSGVTTSDNLHFPTNIIEDVGMQNMGGFVQPRNVLLDFIGQGFLTPVPGSGFVGVMSTSAFPGNSSNVASAYVSGHRVYKLAGDASLTFTYTASQDTYDDIDYNGNITHSAVANNAAAPSQAANTLRLQKVVTNATQITSVTQLASIIPILAKGSIALGNMVVVDSVYGNDSTGARCQSSFATVGAAISAAQSGDIILVLPGTYNLSAAITVPDSVQISGLSGTQTIIQMLNVTSDTTMITMGNSSRLLFLNLKLTSSSAVNLTTLHYPGTTSSTAKAILCNITTDGSGYTGSTVKNIYGILSDGTGTPTEDFTSLLTCSVRTTGTPNGICRGLLVSTANNFNSRDSNFLCLSSGGALGSYIGVETNNASAQASIRTALANGATADISQTAGTLIFEGRLVNHTTNSLPLSTVQMPVLLDFGDPGSIKSAARVYLRPGDSGSSTTEVKIRIPQQGVVWGLDVQAATGPGGALTDTFTVRKNGVDTVLATSLTGAALTNEDDLHAVTFQDGDLLSIAVDTHNSSGTSDVMLTVNLA